MGKAQWSSIGDGRDGTGRGIKLKSQSVRCFVSPESIPCRYILSVNSIQFELGQVD